MNSTSYVIPKIDIFKSLRISKLVAVQPIQIDNVKECKCICMNDSRSAAFYAFGEAVKDQNTVALIVLGEYLSSTYTAITEAWFQKANVVVIALFKSISEANTSWMDRCLVDQITCTEKELDNDQGKIKQMVGKAGPCLIKIIEQYESNEKVDYSNILSNLNEAVKTEDAKIICYNPTLDCRKSFPKIDKIYEKYKYGILSKYIGQSSVTNAGYLVCTVDCVLVDVNIFRTRYKNSNMKIVIYDPGEIMHEQNIDKWIQSNGWLYFNDANKNEVYKFFVESTEPTVLVIGRCG